MTELEFLRVRCQKLEQLVKELFQEAYGHGYDMAHKIMLVLNETPSNLTSAPNPAAIEFTPPPTQEHQKPAEVPTAPPQKPGMLDI